MNAIVKDKMWFVQMCTIRSALKLEIAGMQRSRCLPSAYTVAKRTYGLEGGRHKVLEQLEVLIQEEKERQEEHYRNVQLIK